MGKLFKELTEEKLEQVKTHPYYAKTLKIITERAEGYFKTEPPIIKFSDIHMFATTGSRAEFEAVFNEYQRRLETFFFMYLITKDEKYIEPLSNILWNICDFESWSLPAHVAENLPIERRRAWIDLFAASTGCKIAEILYFIGDKLPELVYRRAKSQVRERIIDSYRDHSDYWWLRCNINWSAVCTGGVGAAYFYLAEKEEVEAMLPKMLDSMDCYLSGIDDDGCCEEGVGYWAYGFSWYCIFASMLREYTDGKIDLFKNEKVHKCALFQQNMSMNEKEAISFGDNGCGFNPSAWFSHFLKNEYSDVEIPTFSESTDTSAFLRNVLWQDPALAECKMNTPKSYIYHEQQWFIHRNENYSLACKAGINNPSGHNHNDIGSFLISKNGRVSFTDPGGGKYTRQYFEHNGERYTKNLACAGRGHSVPIINGEIQFAKKIKSTVYTEKENDFCFSIENGYNITTLKTLTRHFECLTDKVVLTDSYEFTEKPESVVERFVSYCKPEVVENGVKCGESTLCYDPEFYELTISEETFPGYKPAPLYMVDLKVKNPTEKFEASVHII